MQGRGRTASPPWPRGEPGRRVPSPARSRALAMLTLLPVHAAVVPRVHVEPRHPNGSLRLLDRITGEQLLVYTPRFTAQFHAGHRAGRWYVRPGDHVGIDLQEPGLRHRAGRPIEAVAAGRWGRDAAAAHRTGLAPRVVWPVAEDGPASWLRPRPRQENPDIHRSSLIEEHP